MQTRLAACSAVCCGVCVCVVASCWDLLVMVMFGVRDSGGLLLSNCRQLDLTAGSGMLFSRTEAGRASIGFVLPLENDVRTLLGACDFSSEESVQEPQHVAYSQCKRPGFWLGRLFTVCRFQVRGPGQDTEGPLPQTTMEKAPDPIPWLASESPWWS